MRGMQVIRGRDHDAVDALLLVEHLAEVGVLGRFVELLVETHGARIDRIAKAAAASKERLYAHFTDKEALFRSVAGADMALP